MPTKNRWVLQRGWTRYTPDGASESVEYPAIEDQVLVFDVETLPYQGGHYPVMAVAVGESAWYAWCSPWLTGEDDSPNHLVPLGPEAKADEGSTLFESDEETPRLVVGHNVLFDRARVGTEYALRRPATRWLDTLSLHVAVSGLTNPQRPSWIMHRRDQAKAEAAEDALDVSVAVRHARKMEAAKEEALKPKTWKEVSSINSLVEVARLHCGITMDKALRDTFIDPLTTIADVRDEFDSLVAYCATDVLVTLQVLQVLLPKFLATCPHPASFGGILLMSQPVLPVDRRWPQYIERAEQTYEERLKGVKDALKVIVEDARAKFEKVGADGRYEWEDDQWLSQLDWSPKRARRLPGAVPAKLRRKSTTDKEKANKDRFPPVWFSALGKEPIPPTSPLAFLLLRTTYKTFPVVWTHSHGWLFAVPSRRKSFVPTSKETLVDSSALGTKDDLARSLPGVKLYSVPGRGAGRCMTLGGPTWTKRIEEGVLECPFDEMKSAATELSTKATRALAKKLATLAKDSIRIPSEERMKEVWLRQLDWTPDLEAKPLPKVRAKVERVEEEVESAPEEEEEAVVVDRNELVWPKWYWDLDAPGLGLDVSIGKRAVPLLLKLQWKGFPIVHSKEHGWIYCVPSAQVDDMLAADSSLKPLAFEDVADSNLGEDRDAAFFKLPHPDGEGKNVGSPLSKPFVAAFEDKVLTSEYPAAAAALAMNASCSYWTSSRERIVNQMVVWEGDAKTPPPTPSAIAASPALESTQGLILPQVIPMGTVTRRAVEKTWLTASNAKKNRVGSELKSMIRAPPGYAIVGADVDSEELWICSVMGDAQFGIHGATAIGWMTLEGTKAAGTDLHSKSASILGISRDDAKVFNYSRIYGAGVKHAVQLLLKSNPSLTTDKATALAKALYAGTKGVTHRGRAFDRQFWHGGTESFVFNKLEQIAQSDKPRTPALGCGLTDALTKAFLPAEGRSKAGEGFMPSRINWVVQSSGVDYLHLLLVAMEYLTKRFAIDARYMISVHDEIRYLVKEEDKYRLAMALQISNLWTRSLFSYRLQMGDLPQVRFSRFLLQGYELTGLNSQGCAFFSAVDIDHCFRKEVNMTCVTPSNPDSIPFGESLDISDSLAKTHHGSLYADGRSMKEPAVPDSTLPYELSDAEVRGEEHRVGTTPFLIAQTKTSTTEIYKLWDEAGGSSTRRPWSKGRSSPAGSSDGGSRNYQRYDELSYLELDAPKRARAAPKRVGRAEPPRSAETKAKAAKVVKAKPTALKSLQMYEDLAAEEDWDLEDVPEELGEDAFRQPASFRAQV